MSTIPETKVAIENPDQASTNFFWTYESGNQIFNLQTTIRGILTYPQIQAHIKAALEAAAHVQELGGIAKQVGGKSYSEQPAPVAAEIPTATPLNEIPGYTAPGEPEYQEPQHQAPPHEEGVNQFDTEHLLCEIRDNKQFFKIKGGMYKKFGITVWPEVLTAAGIPVGKLEGKEYNLVGYRAEFALNDKGKPSKIIKLEKVAS